MRRLSATGLATRQAQLVRIVHRPLACKRSDRAVRPRGLMTARQDAKHEKILKGLLKQNENRQCANCGSLVGGCFLALPTTVRQLLPTPGVSLFGLVVQASLHTDIDHLCHLQGPQYIVTDFNIFVCTVCSGVQYVPGLTREVWILSWMPCISRWTGLLTTA